jgi:major curlin subunit
MTMSRKIVNMSRIALLAAAVGLPSLSAPAMAGGSVSLYFSPRMARDAQALDLGLRAYSLYEGFRSGANIRQLGSNNRAGIGQNGSGNLGIVRQEGAGHSATLQQNGNDNTYGIFQFGRNTVANITQSGDESGLALQFGW